MGPMFVVLLLLVWDVECLRDYRYLSQNVSSTLDSLLANDRYDKRIRPGFGGPPIPITVNLVIKSIGPVLDDDQSFGMDCYFRQNWYDTRLKYQKLPGLSEFSLSWLFLDKVWKPDTYFLNGKKSYLHRITVPNKFLRLRYDGLLTYSMRLTIKASCPMFLRKFPLDAQKCPLLIGSFGYTATDVVYIWSGDDDNPVSIGPEAQLASFDLGKITTNNESTVRRGDLDYSIIEAHFELKRHTGYFMLQMYVPACLIVMCSWVSFWIDPDAAPARVTLGVTTVLSMTNMGFGGRAQLPKVSYWTALDWFVIICFTYVFSVMIEYAVVNFTDKVIKELKKTIEQKKKEKEEKEKAEKETDMNIEDEKKLLDMKPDRMRARSTSLTLTTSLIPEQPCRRVSVAGDVPAERSGPKLTRLAQEFGSKLSLKNVPQKVTTKIKSLITVGEQKLTKSIQDLTKAFDAERGRREPQTIPKLVISSSSEDISLEPIELITPLDTEVFLEENGHQDDLVLEVENAEETEWEDVEEAVELQSSKILSLLRKLKHPKDLMQNIKLMPNEDDVIQLMKSTEPPDKFSKIDIDARRTFPLTFCASIFIYLIAFTYYLTDDFPEREKKSLLMQH